jgi:hypothetical protein
LHLLAQVMEIFQLQMIIYHHLKFNISELSTKLEVIPQGSSVLLW